MIDITSLQKALPANYLVQKINQINSNSYIDFSAVEIRCGDYTITVSNLISVCGGGILSYLEGDDELSSFVDNVVKALKAQQIGYIQYVVAENQDDEDLIREVLEEMGFNKLEIGYNPKTENDLTLYYLTEK